MTQGFSGISKPPVFFEIPWYLGWDEKWPTCAWKKSNEILAGQSLLLWVLALIYSVVIVPRVSSHVSSRHIDDHSFLFPHPSHRISEFGRFLSPHFTIIIWPIWVVCFRRKTFRFSKFTKSKYHQIPPPRHRNCSLKKIKTWGVSTIWIKYASLPTQIWFPCEQHLNPTFSINISPYIISISKYGSWLKKTHHDSSNWFPQVIDSVLGVGFLRVRSPRPPWSNPQKSNP